MIAKYFPLFLLREVETGETSGKITLNKHVYIDCDWLLFLGSASLGINHDPSLLWTKKHWPRRIGAIDVLFDC